MRLLLMSSSSVGNGAYLQSAVEMLPEFLGDTRDLLFVSYAAVAFSHQEYTAKVRTALASLDIDVRGIEEFDDPREAVSSAKAIAVGGGNTFALVSRCQRERLFDVIRERVMAGIPYTGWSAGSNIAAPSLATTNDMPIIEPESFETLGLLPFQINAHYTDWVPPNHHGETRQQRLEEFLAVNPEACILALPEGSTVLVDGDRATLLGGPGAFWFEAGSRKKELAQGYEIDLRQVK